MSLINIMLKIAGKDDFQLDRNISSSYILSQCWKYGCMMVRGKIFAFGKRGIARNVFVGNRTKFLCTKKLILGDKCILHDGVYIDALSSCGVKLGSRVVIGRNTRMECTGSLAKIGKGIVIGDRTTFGSNCYFGAAGGIEIGKDVVAGQYIRFHAENHNFDDLNVLIKEQGVSQKGIKIGNNCWIGAGVVFLDGAELADGCVVAANAVVTKKFPENSIVGGIPAKLLKHRGENSDYC